VIFVAVGTQLPFDRLIRAVDEWAGSRNRRDVFAQIGPAKYHPQYLDWSEFIDASEFRHRVSEADVVIAHAGMGSIITALELGKAIIVMPRLASLGEHRNDHQVATAKRFLSQGRINVAFDEQELSVRLDSLEQLTRTQARCGPIASPELIEGLRRFLRDGHAGLGGHSGQSVPSTVDPPIAIPDQVRESTQVGKY
jgi:UDP-N-acetylglucosamine transferase subunit ALG13